MADEKRQEVGVLPIYVLGGKYRSIHLHTPQHHDLDHCAIITKIHVGSATRMVAYQKWMAKFPLKLPSGPQDELCALFKGL